MGLANIVTLLRIVLLPVIIFFILQETMVASLAAIFLLLLAVISDILDGYLARKRKEVTKVGSFLDPVADKIMIYALLFLYLLRGSFWWFPFLLFVIRDLVVVAIRWLASQEDVIISEEVYRRMITYTRFALLFSLLFTDFFLFRGQLYGMTIAGQVTFILTLLSMFLAVLSILYHVWTYVKGLHLRRKVGKEIEKKPMIIIANPKSSAYRNVYRRHLLNIFAKRRGASILYLPKSKDMYQGLSKQLKPYPHLIIAGGDGSFESALNYAPFQRKSLGFFPLGSGNAFYSYFYKGKRFEYLRSRFQFRETEIDVLELEWNHRTIETMFLSIGVDAEVIHYRSTGKLGFLWYLISSLNVAFKVKSDYKLKCTVDRKKYRFQHCVNFTLAKIPYYGFALRSLVGEVNPNDGKVYGVAVVNTHSKIWNKAVRVLGLLLAAMNLEKSPLLSLKGERIVVESETPFPIQAGGEFLGYATRMAIRVKRRQKVLLI